MVLSQEPNRQGSPIAEFRWIHPDQQLRSILSLFEGARYPHPAAVMTAWKAAKGEEGSLGKPLEAVITLLNPEMVTELRSMHQATLLLDLSPNGGWGWSAAVPSDDGTFSAVITAMTLTDGTVEEHLAGGVVHRLGPRGSPLAWVRDKQIRIASTRELLTHEQERNLPLPEIAAGLSGAVQLDALRSRVPVGASLSTWERTIVKSADAIKARYLSITVTAAESSDSSRVLVRGELADPLGSQVETIRPEWLARLPWKRAAIVGSLGIEPSVSSWNRILELLDAVDRSTPERSGLAPLGVRVTLAAAAVGLRPEADLWAKALGLSFCAWGEVIADKVVPRWIITVHARDPEAAAQIGHVLTRRPANAAEKNRDGFLPRLIALPSDWLKNLVVRGDRVILVSDQLALAAADEVDQAGAELPWPKSPPDVDPSRIQRMLMLEPERLPSDWLARLPIVLRTAIAQGPRLQWAGGQIGDRSFDSITLSDLKPAVRRWLEAIPIPPKPPAPTQ